jgi:hypothetical protein
MSYGRYRCIFFALAEYDSEGVAYTKLMEDFPVVLGAPVFYDSIDVYKPYGRDPVDQMPLWVDQAVSRYKMTPTTHGIQSLGAVYAPDYGVVPDAAMTDGWVTNAGVIGSIDAVGKYFVVGVYPQDIVGDDIPAPLQPYAADVPMPQDRWDELYAGMLARGMDQTKIDNWRANHPDATPFDIRDAFASYVE